MKKYIILTKKKETQLSNNLKKKIYIKESLKKVKLTADILKIKKIKTVNVILKFMMRLIISM